MKMGARVIMACRSSKKAKSVSNQTNLPRIRLTIDDNKNVLYQNRKRLTAHASCPNPGDTVLFLSGGGVATAGYSSLVSKGYLLYTG